MTPAEHEARINAIAVRVHETLRGETNIGDCIVAMIQCITMGLIHMDPADQKVIRKLMHDFVESLYDTEPEERMTRQ